MASALDLLKLADRYERKARLLPALLSSLVMVPAVAALSQDALGWFASFSVGAGFASVGAVGLSYAASAAGRYFERQLWPRWPHDAPTNRWLQPNDTSCSQEQKRLWYEAIKRLVGLDIPNVASQENETEVDRVINDAIRALRHHFRQIEFDGLLATHNEDYGFARNFAGLRIFWIPAAGASAIITWTTHLMTGTEIIWGIMALVVLVLCLILVRFLPEYVRQRADRYAESFFGTLSSVDRAANNESSGEGK